MLKEVLSTRPYLKLSDTMHRKGLKTGIVHIVRAIRSIRMKHVSKIAIATFASLVAGAATAAPVHLGSNITDIRSHYAQAVRVHLPTGGAALEITDIDYAGVHWAKVDFVLDAYDRLSSLAMHTTAVSYDQALAMALQQQSGPGGLQAAATRAGAAGDVQIRVCEDDGGEITVAYELQASTS